MSGPSQNLTDEQLAAALQQQYRMEFLQRQEEQQQQQQSQRNLTRIATTAPPETEVVYNGSRDEVYAHQLQRQMHSPSIPSRIQNVGFQASIYDNNANTNTRPDAPQSRPDAPGNNAPRGDIEDVVLAQQLQDEELARQYSRRYNQQNQTIASSGTLFDNYTQTRGTHDVETQRQLSQQLTDAELAQNLAQREQEEALRRDREQQSQLQNQSKWYRRILPLFILAAAITIPLLFVFGVFSKNDVPFLDGFGNDWVDSDPWSDVGSINGNSSITVGDSAVRWANNGNGLNLEIWNAMEDKYDALFATAVANWESGAPIDSLTLSTRRVNYDSECKDENGILKVCSGNYGATKWRGLNEVKLNSLTRIIVSSVAKMNNFYLDTESEEQRLYTICHELGHGFGLPHWDVDFYNRDLGNCMDYTIRPENNMKPSTSNFEYLARLYGGRNVATVSAIQAPETAPDSENEFDLGKKDKKDKGKKGERRRILHKSDVEEVHLVHLEEEGMVLLRQYRF
ncbi:unnamed protein product [Cylindrotheca closterium]|uniref:Peptidase M10 metallopeptidase domain-containing protein n=1 Tax=Cylindrotheca closterium TaxID=2856 RepID=A0AAD2G529_9STRA|nr:unnamed protein product [Cylindrotheca closterium]